MPLGHSYCSFITYSSMLSTTKSCCIRSTWKHYPAILAGTSTTTGSWFLSISQASSLAQFEDNSFPSVSSKWMIMLCKMMQHWIQCTTYSRSLWDQRWRWSSCRDWNLPFGATKACSTQTQIWNRFVQTNKIVTNATTDFWQIAVENFIWLWQQGCSDCLKGHDTPCLCRISTVSSDPVTIGYQPLQVLCYLCSLKCIGIMHTSWVA